MEPPERAGNLSAQTLTSSSGRIDSNGKLSGGSGPGSSEDSLASEVGRLAEENSRYRQKLADLMGKSTALPPPSKTSSSQLVGNAERMQEQLRRLRKENHRLVEQNQTLERRLSCSRSSASGDQLWRYKEEVRNLRSKNAELMREKDKFDRTAEYVCQKVLKIIGAARREGNFNSQLVGELKRWNEKLEDENHRLYNIIDRMQSKGNDVDDAVAEATVLSKAHNKDRDGNAAIVKELETQNVKIQEEMSKLSDQAMTLQNLSSSSSGSSGPLPPRTPSNHELDGSLASRRSRSPLGDRPPRGVAGRQRLSDARNRKPRNLSMESLGSDAKDLEDLKLNNKKYTEEIERIGADLAFVREQVAAKSFNLKKGEGSNLEDVSSRMQSLEHANTAQAEEIERLLNTQSDMKNQSQQLEQLKDDYAELEDDCLKLAGEVERLQPLANKVAESEALVEEYRRKLEELDGNSPQEVGGAKSDHVEMQRTLSAMAAEKAVLQAELRELLEERAQLQSELTDLDLHVQELQERANSATYLQSELEVAKEENLAYVREIENLNLEKEQLRQELRDLEQQNGGSFVRAGSSSRQDAELARLKAENEDLASKSFNTVILNVELTTLKNKVKDLEEMEVNYQEQISRLKQDKASLERDVESIPALKAEISELHAKVRAAEQQQGQHESDLEYARNSPQQAELVREHEDRGRRVRDLKAENGRMEADLSKTETRLRSLQAKYDSLLKDHTQRSQQAVREQEDAESQGSVLRLALVQERGKASDLARETAELHALLQTAHNERQALQSHLADLRQENALLVQRATQLDAKNEDQEKTLQAVLSQKGMSNGHNSPQKVRGEQLERVSPAYSIVSPSSPFKTASNTSSKSKTSPSPDTNGKSDKNGFGSFFKRDKKAKPSQPVQSQPVQSSQSTQSGRPDSKQLHNLASMPSNHEESSPEAEVMAAYDQYVDGDDIDGFMAALGFKGFKSPTAYDDMKGAFASAKYVVRPEVLANLSPYNRQKAEATYDLLEAWQAAWVESLADQGIDYKLLKS